MNYNEIQEALNQLAEQSYLLESEYTENGGEVTETTEAMENQVAALKALLTTEGVDTLGRWLKAKEDAIKALKSEKDYVTRRIKATENTIDFIKREVNHILAATGEEKIKGSLGYSFTASVSRTTSADKDILKDRYQSIALAAIHSAGVPECVGLSLTASATLVPEGEELPDFFTVTETPTCRFAKPRAAKEEE